VCVETAVTTDRFTLAFIQLRSILVRLWDSQLETGSHVIRPL